MKSGQNPGSRISRCSAAQPLKPSACSSEASRGPAVHISVMYYYPKRVTTLKPLCPAVEYEGKMSNSCIWRLPFLGSELRGWPLLSALRNGNHVMIISSIFAARESRRPGLVARMCCYLPFPFPPFFLSVCFPHDWETIASSTWSPSPIPGKIAGNREHLHNRL